MSHDQMITAGAFALYRAEQAHRIHEFRKHGDAESLIQQDFQQFRSRYVHKFNDFMSALQAEGLTVAVS